MIPDTKSLILASLSLAYSLHRPQFFGCLLLFQNRPFSLQRHRSPPQSSLSPRLLEETCLRETLVARGLGRAPPCLQTYACSTCASPSCTTLSSVENTFHRHRFTKYYHNLQLKIRGVLGAVLDTWMVVRCWALKSIFRERKKQGRLTSDSDRKSLLPCSSAYSRNSVLSSFLLPTGSFSGLFFFFLENSLIVFVKK